MIVADVNIMVAAFRLDHPHHTIVRTWFDRQLASAGSLLVPDLVWAGFVRIVTSKRVFRIPATVDNALDFVDAVRSQPSYLAVPPLPDVLSVFSLLCRTQQVSGNLVTDAYIASVAMSLGAPVVTLDRDFRRFESLKIVEPRES
jgi:toxin-antitoxin system PIN domain toxin